ncbi:MAG: KH domain-containing protein [Acidobacteria bacterium]|nr:KH domain-containing protein [Acidobacteriota bacterium]
MTDLADTGAEDTSGPDLVTATSVLAYLVKQLVEHPDAVDVELDDRGRRPVLNVKVAPGDMGRVIGKRGRVAQSIRTVVRAAAARDGGDVEVEFLD